jgi:hypothetical protein
MVIDMPICANDAADMASITSANNSERMEGTICIVLPLARSSLACPVMLSLLRVAWMERHDFRTKRTAHFVSLANGSAMSFSFREFYVWSKMLSSRTEAGPPVSTLLEVALLRTLPGARTGGLEFAQVFQTGHI